MKALLCTVPLNVGAPRHDSEFPVTPKIAIVSLIKWMERHGYARGSYDFYDIDMLDPDDDEIRRYFESCRPDVVGFSAVVSTSYMQVKRLSRILREACPDAWIVMGGNLAASANAVLRNTEVDVCVQGDGEMAWVGFLDYAKRRGRRLDAEELSGIKGLAFLDESGELRFTGYGDGIPPSMMPFPDYDILALGLKDRPEMINNYFRNGLGCRWFRHDPRSFEKHRGPRFASLWLSKGCVARCTFCQRASKGYRLYNLDGLDEHLALLRKRYDVGFIQLVDENFGSNKAVAYEMARLMKKHDMLWICGGIRCTSVTEEDVKFYKEHNCSGLKYGVESGSQKILDLMEKKFTVGQVYDALGHCIKYGVYSPLAVMTGMPGDTDETARQTGELIGNVALMQNVHPSRLDIDLFYALPLPGTPLYEYGQQTGMIGSSAEEEEGYLKSVSDVNVSRMKTNYINLNGSSMRKVLFWDTLIRLEANRTYYGKLGARGGGQGATAAPAGPPEGLSRSSDGREGVFAYSWRVFMTYVVRKRCKGLRASVVSKFSNKANALKVRFINSRFAARLPRQIVDGAIKNAMYAAYLPGKWAAVARYWINKASGGDPMLQNSYRGRAAVQITDEELESLGDGINRSLRNIVRLRREGARPPETVTEKNRVLLNMGR